MRPAHSAVVTASLHEWALCRCPHSTRSTQIAWLMCMGGNLAEGDPVFRWWNDLITFLHAETCFRHRELGLIPEYHWRGYQRFITDYLRTPGAPEFLQDVGSGLSEELSGSVTGLLRQHAKENT